MRNRKENQNYLQGRAGYSKTPDRGPGLLRCPEEDHQSCWCFDIWGPGTVSVPEGNQATGPAEAGTRGVIWGPLKGRYPDCVQ